MPFDVPLSCRCGRVRGLASEIAPSAGFRLVCYCKDCQAFARFLAHVPEGGAPVFRQGYAPMQEPGVLDAAGGTDIFQMPPAPVKLSAGTDVVRCLSFSGKVLRWYADCCRTPIANTAANAHFPVVALIHSCMDHEAPGRSRDEALGLPLCRIYERAASGPLPPNAPPPSLGMFVRRAAKILGWWARGLGRPNPFFDPQTNAPLSAPRIVTRSERAALERDRQKQQAL
jgi:Family of unknown function (DUF6151)